VTRAETIAAELQRTSRVVLNHLLQQTLAFYLINYAMKRAPVPARSDFTIPIVIVTAGFLFRGVSPPSRHIGSSFPSKPFACPYILSVATEPSR
jgi:drug/metabolite transporter (DMT)-like permease